MGLILFGMVCYTILVLSAYIVFTQDKTTVSGINRRYIELSNKLKSVTNDYASKTQLSESIITLNQRLALSHDELLKKNNELLCEIDKAKKQVSWLEAKANSIPMNITVRNVTKKPKQSTFGWPKNEANA